MRHPVCRSLTGNRAHGTPTRGNYHAQPSRKGPRKRTTKNGGSGPTRTIAPVDCHGAPGRRPAGAAVTVRAHRQRRHALVAELGDRARAANPSEAASAGDLVLAAVPLAAHERLPRAELSGKTVIDPMNYAVYPGFSVPRLDSNELTSSELVQRHLAGSRVVKALHSIGPKQLLELFRPAGADDRTTARPQPPCPTDPRADPRRTTVLPAATAGARCSRVRAAPGRPRKPSVAVSQRQSSIT
ncbi:NADPH-dependent F420 reductase [Streptomyces sp. NPDC059894]|uniref:NADPH-dependent F420 reductase n=1 Tax=unclassified Streptomyces TaxID=2593676 RepID=UPI00364989F8